MEKAGIVDDLIVYKMNDEKIFCSGNASNIEKIGIIFLIIMKKFGAQLSKFQMKLLSSRFKSKSSRNPSKLTDTNLSEIPYYHFTVGTVAGRKRNYFQTWLIQEVAVSEIYFGNEKCRKTLGRIDKWKNWTYSLWIGLRYFED